ncbi:MAG: shikimate dehydrogenase [candidate division Zixibacteria bacterium]|nr:shikimate dehydrogenase [candidate division Zixibacteria bacterium]
MKKAKPPGLAGIIGYPLDHSLSPFIHNLGFALKKLPYVFVKIEIPPARLNRTVGALVDLGFIGANVTMPHKEASARLVDALSPEARAVGAVNTLVISGRKIKGYNTDIEGFARSLKAFARDRSFPTAAIFGAGGAAAAVGYALFRRFQTRHFHFICRNWRKAKKNLSEKPFFGKGFWADFVDWEDAERAVRASNLIVNATPVGMEGKKTFPVSPAAFRFGQTACDLIYNPPLTPFMRLAKKGGAKAMGGLEMLLQQAAVSFELWTGEKMPVEKVRQELLDSF